MIKIYETINDARLVTTVEVAGVERVVSFVGGRVIPQWRAAIYLCEDPMLQTALESSSAYGVSYRLRESVAECEVTDQREQKNVEEVTNRQSAIEWIRIHLGVKLSPLSRVEAIRRAASDRGFTFLNWNVENGK